MNKILYLHRLGGIGSVEAERYKYYESFSDWIFTASAAAPAAELVRSWYTANFAEPID